jgi:hypothetical protein
VRVDLSRVQMLMPQVKLQRSQVRAVFQHERGRSMAKQMTTPTDRDPRQLDEGRRGSGLDL